MNSYASISQLLGLSCIGNEAADRRNIESAIEALRTRLAEVEAERDAARAVLAGAMATAKSLAEERDRAVERSNFFEAGEARAVYALRAVVAAVLPHEEDTWTMEGSALRHVHRVLDRYEPTPDNQPSALDWLAQQRREAAAEALENVRIGWLSDNDYRPGVPEIWRYIANRAAALRAGEVPND